MSNRRVRQSSMSRSRVDHHNRIRRDGQRQFQRECDGRYEWGRSMPKPERVKRPLSRQQRRLEEREEAKRIRSESIEAAANRRDYLQQRRRTLKAVAADQARREAAAGPDLVDGKEVTNRKQLLLGARQQGKSLLSKIWPGRPHQ